MSRRFTVVTVVLTAVVSFLLGLVVSGSIAPSSVVTAEPPRSGQATPPAVRVVRPGLPAVVDFADVAQHINPAVVNVEAASKRRRGPAFHGQLDGAVPRPVPEGHPLDPGQGPGEDHDGPQEGSGSGFIIEPDGHILTNYHVIEGADRIVVKLADGRSLRAKVVGVDPPTDIALIKVESESPLPAAPLGNSESLRVGEWVCAIGNPLAYEHTVTVGVVSYLGRKLFDASLDDYIQTDAAINFGNSGGPLINARGEVIGINTAISWRASSIGFAIPINMARGILPQLRERGRVSRGYVGLTLRELDPDVRESLRLGAVQGALVQDVAADSPGERAGIRPYDVIVSVDLEPVRTNDDLVRQIARSAPGTFSKLEVVREGRTQLLTVRLAERPSDEPPMEDQTPAPGSLPRPGAPGSTTPAVLFGLHVRELDRPIVRRLELPLDLHGVYVSSVDALSGAAEAGFVHGDIILEINRKPVTSMRDYLRLLDGAADGMVYAFLCYIPELDQRVLRTMRVETGRS
jgi:serine protease Do